jgi:hypothetical protein
MALLLFNESEILQPPLTVSDAGINKLTRNFSTTVSEFLKPEAGVFAPALTLQSYEDPNAVCQVVDISTATFVAVMPRLQELKYLAHCRQVNTDNKIILGLDEEGWFSVVIGNRLPSPPTPKTNGQAGQPGNLNIAHLVSLEGFNDFLVDAPGFPTGTTKVRLISLSSWVFTCLPEEGESFANLMLGLISEQSEAGTSLLLKLPPTSNPPDEPTEAEKIVANRISAGYGPMGYQTRQGEQTFAWYRGPLSPVLTARFTDRDPFDTAAEAIIYDSTTGLFDHSYSVAWQLGRLLALSDRSFAVNLLKWRREAHQLIDLLLDRLNAQNETSLLSDPNNVAQLNTLLDQNLITQQFLNALVKDLSQGFPAPVSNSGSSSRRQPSASDSSTVSRLQNLLNDPQVQALLQEMSDPDQNSLMEQIVAWLARLSLLYGVPFEHLVPFPAMLPPESIRLFYIDQNWIDCMIDGALNVGVHSSRDSLYDSLMRDTLNDAVDAASLQVRDLLVGIKTGSGPEVTGSMAGFLLRSAVVSGWPGLEVKAYRQTDGQTPGGPIKLLRMDRLAPDVLLCIFPEVPAWVELDEPQEGLHFGIEDNNQIGLRYLTGPNVGDLIGRTVTATTRSSLLALDISALQASMQKRLADQLGATNVLGPADFAVQLVAVPEQMVFQIEH